MITSSNKKSYFKSFDQPVNVISVRTPAVKEQVKLFHLTTNIAVLKYIKQTSIQQDHTNCYENYIHKNEASIRNIEVSQRKRDQCQKKS